VNATPGQEKHCFEAVLAKGLIINDGVKNYGSFQGVQENCSMMIGDIGCPQKS
jgi:hypothetical protein